MKIKTQIVSMRKTSSYVIKIGVSGLFMILGTSCIWAQEITKITGTVLNEQETSVPHADLYLEDGSHAGNTDEKGNFSFETGLSVPFKFQIIADSYQRKVIEYKGQELPIVIVLSKIETDIENLVITARRRSEKTQDVPIPITVVTGATVEDAGAFNVNRVKELVPTVQLYSSNPRNTTLNIRGLGSTFGLTNDGIDPGVGFYVDGVYYARPAATTLDFVDIEQIEVLRGPQGTLFGKNTTAGAFNITTAKPTFKQSHKFEVSYGNYNYIQAKASISGPLSKKIAARVSFSGTTRDGTILNVRTSNYINDLSNIGIKAQLLYNATDKVTILFSGDYNTQRPDGYAQVYAGVVKTQRDEYRQFNSIISDLNYTLPSLNAFDRIIDHDTPWRSNNDLGGASINIDVKIGKGTLTSTTAWRFWNWNPSNDRDFTGLAMLALSQAPSNHHQLSQEVRYSGDFSSKLSGVVGVYAIAQDLRSAPYHTEEAGDAQWRFAQNSTSPLWQTPGLFEGYGIRTTSNLRTFSGAVFGQLDWKVFNKFHLLPGIRFNYDQKYVNYERKTYGGLQTNDPDLLELLRRVYSDQSFTANVDDVNLSGQLTATYRLNNQFNAFATFSTGYKPVGINLGGLPTENGQPMVELARVNPERVYHYEVGIKSSPIRGSIANLTFYNTDIYDFQTLVQSPQLGVNRGYLANAEQVNVMGLELDIKSRINEYVSFYGSVAYTEAIYKKFENAPVPLEETGAPVAFKDVSGGRLPGVSKWAGSVGVELSLGGKLLGNTGKFFLAADSYFRSDFSSSPSPSQYLNVGGYGLLNARIGYRADNGLTFFVWGRNILDRNYYEQLLVGAGNAGHYAGVLGDPRTVGATIRYTFNQRD